MARLRTHGDGKTVRSTTNNLQRQVGLVAMDTNEHACVNFIMPDGEVGMVRVDFNFGVNFGILGTVIRHGNEHRLRPIGY